MKLTGIRIGYVNSRGKTIGLDDFRGCEEAKSKLGKLLIELAEETAWSGEYEVSASFDEKAHLVIDHPTFLSERSLFVTNLDSVREVEDAIREHISSSQKEMRPAIALLQNRVNKLHHLFGKIGIDKAKVAVISAFPEVGGLKQVPSTGRSDLYSFAVDFDREPIFVVRALNHEFVGGVARIHCNGLYWYAMKDGIEKDQRHGLFWAELARAFASHELQIPEKDLYCESVHASEKPWAFPRIEPYVVEKVVLHASGQKEDIIVLFGADNLPVFLSTSPASA